VIARRAAFASGLLRGLLSPRHASYAVFFLTDLCNARCPYCFNTRLSHLDAGHVPADRNGRLLSAAEYGRVAENARPLFQAVFGGGEPFLREEIDAIAKAFYEKGGTRLFSIPTNGYLPDKAAAKLEAMLAACPKATFNLMVSLDALGAKHDELRKLPGGFERARQLCRKVLELGKKYGNVNLVINTAVTGSNAAEVAELKTFLAEELKGEPWHHNLQYEQRLGERPAVNAASNGGGATWTGRAVSRWYVDFINDLIGRQMSGGKMVYKCNAGRKLFVMMPDGEVSPCEPFVFERTYASFPKFDIRKYDYDFRKVQADPTFRRQLEFIEAGQCEACPWTCAAITSMTYSPSNWPLFLALVKR
jgi:radical SAM protein with 4Fe4S-binding SPASM domain